MLTEGGEVNGFVGSGEPMRCRAVGGPRNALGSLVLRFGAPATVGPRDDVEVLGGHRSDDEWQRWCRDGSAEAGDQIVEASAYSSFVIRRASPSL